MTNLGGALEAWGEALGPENVLTDEESLAARETATFPTDPRVPAVIRPGTREQVQEALRIANRFRVPVYPVSRGRNWGYGSRVPARDGCVVLELARLDRIVEYDERLSYLTVEPGVTFRKAWSFLRSRRSTLFLGMPGTTPDASIVGNAIERGHVSGSCADRFASVSTLEVVLPTGELIHTGMGRYPLSRSSPVHRWGVGPYLDGLFSQSNLGVVTRMTVWLTAIPARLDTCVFWIEDQSRLAALVDGLRDAVLQGRVDVPVRLSNDGALTAPDESGSSSAEVIWSGMAGLYSPDSGIAAQRRRALAEALSPVSDVLGFLDDEGFEVVHGSCAPARHPVMQPGRSRLLGNPSMNGILYVYRKLSRLYPRTSISIGTVAAPSG